MFELKNKTKDDNFVELIPKSHEHKKKKQRR